LRLGVSLMGKRLVVALIIAVIAVCTAPITTAASVVTTKTGTLSDGATYLIEVPSNWNRTLLLYSHGYVTPGSDNPARDVGDPFTRGFLLGQGWFFIRDHRLGPGAGDPRPDRDAGLVQQSKLWIWKTCTHHRLGTLAGRDHHRSFASDPVGSRC
jgi:hypothetical protein